MVSAKGYVGEIVFYNLKNIYYRIISYFGTISRAYTHRSNRKVSRGGGDSGLKYYT